MKKNAFIIITMIILAGLSGPVRSQILDNPPRDVIYYDNDLEDVKPIPIPEVRKADIMWSKRIWRELDMRQKMNQPFYYPLEPHNNCHYGCP
jgi:hypothetical protein